MNPDDDHFKMESYRTLNHVIGPDFDTLEAKDCYCFKQGPVFWE
ncbi:hypothetical protein Mpsy_2463 [Methanolobus psychrophilus R15]|nr:hypothetical protein Mpsy_2463 [Methanolobus psychrophilus R15]